EDRTGLNALLREVAQSGVWVSAHPDTIERMGTKEVLFQTRNMAWGGETRLYSTPGEFREQFPASLGAGHPRVLKENRSNGGLGVWKVALADEAAREGGATATTRSLVRIQHAATRDSRTEDVVLGEFMERWE